MKHTHTVRNYTGSQEQLAEEIGDLFYDSLAGFLQALASKIESDADKDAARGRRKLAGELQACARHLQSSAQHIATAWEICAPHVPPGQAAQEGSQKDGA